MNPVTVAVYVVLVAIIGVAIYGTVKRARHGSSCCGEREAAPKKVKVSDRKASNYPYFYELRVDGMHCSNCARRVENAFNSTEGLWATADVGEKTVKLRSKMALNEAVCWKTLDDAGYTMLSMKEIK
jgi:copper chaperone CopZ